MILIFHEEVFGCVEIWIEIFPAHEDSLVIRLEFFDDELESISLVDPLRGKVEKTLNKVTIYPKSHYVVGQDILERSIKTIRIELRERLCQLEEENKLVEKQRLEQRTLYDLENDGRDGVLLWY